MSSPFGSDIASLLHGLRSSPVQQQYPTLGQVPSYSPHEQLLLAHYQQRQFELAQQQQLELQMRMAHWDQMRLHNLALQEQLREAQAHAQVEAAVLSRMEERAIYSSALKSAPAMGSRFALVQGGVLAERAMARRQAQEEAPFVNSPSVSPSQGFGRPAHTRQSSWSSPAFSSPRDSNSPTPAVILSKPGEAFPSSERIHDQQLGHKHSNSDSSASTRSSTSLFSHSREASEGDSLDSPPSEVAAFEKRSDSPSFKMTINPLAPVFVPTSVALLPSPSTSATPPNVYRPRAGSPLPFATRHAPAVLAVASRQPKGPPSSAEDLDAQNFNARRRERAIANIKALGVRAMSPPASPNPAIGVGSLGELKSPGLMTLVQATKAREERAARAERQ